MEKKPAAAVIGSRELVDIMPIILFEGSSTLWPFGGLEVIYHETKAPWIARRLAKEYLQKGNKILYARFYTNGTDTVQYELAEWAGLLAECLIEE